MHKYKRIGVFLPEEILKHAPSEEEINKIQKFRLKKSDVNYKQITTKNINGVKVKIISDRLRMFASKDKNHGIICRHCGIVGRFCALERHNNEKQNNELYHFNLYGVKNGKEVQLTKDHIVPKCRGGKNSLRNYQTLCFDCNLKKRDTNNNTPFNLKVIPTIVDIKGNEVVPNDIVKDLRKQEATNEKVINIDHGLNESVIYLNSGSILIGENNKNKVKIEVEKV